MPDVPGDHRHVDARLPVWRAEGHDVCTVQPHPSAARLGTPRPPIPRPVRRGRGDRTVTPDDALADPTLTNAEIARLYGVTDRTVIRWRARMGMPSTWAPTPPEHGTLGRYRAGCRCSSCRAVNARRVRDEFAAKQAITARRAARTYQPWMTWEDDRLRAVGPTRAALDLGRTYSACVQRARRL